MGLAHSTQCMCQPLFHVNLWVCMLPTYSLTLLLRDSYGDYTIFILHQETNFSMVATDCWRLSHASIQTYGLYFFETSVIKDFVFWWLSHQRGEQVSWLCYRLIRPIYSSTLIRSSYALMFHSSLRWFWIFMLISPWFSQHYFLIHLQMFSACSTPLMFDKLWLSMFLGLKASVNLLDCLSVAVDSRKVTQLSLNLCPDSFCHCISLSVSWEDSARCAEGSFH